jgi:hypothetical protein
MTDVPFRKGFQCHGSLNGEEPFTVPTAFAFRFGACCNRSEMASLAGYDKAACRQHSQLFPMIQYHLASHRPGISTQSIINGTESAAGIIKWTTFGMESRRENLLMQNTLEAMALPVEYRRSNTFEAHCYN